MTTSFHPVGDAGDIAEGGMVARVVAGWPVLIARNGGRLNAVIDRCTHAASPLSTGRVRRGAVMCPLHGARFELATGRCLGGGYAPLMTFTVREDPDGGIQVAVPDEAPGQEHLPVRPR